MSRMPRNLPCAYTETGTRLHPRPPLLLQCNNCLMRTLSMSTMTAHIRRIHLSTKEQDMEPDESLLEGPIDEYQEWSSLVTRNLYHYQPTATTPPYTSDTTPSTSEQPEMGARHNTHLQSSATQQQDTSVVAEQNPPQAPSEAVTATNTIQHIP